MKLPSRLVRNRHGVFYFRVTFFGSLRRQEQRWSLRTKSPTVARYLALQLNAALQHNSGRFGFSTQTSGIHRDDHWDDGIKAMIEKNLYDLIHTFERADGTKLTQNFNASDPNEVAEANNAAQKFINGEWMPSGVEQRPVPSVDGFLAAAAGKKAESLFPLVDLIAVYMERKKGALGSKTLYENEKMLHKFADWIATQKKSEKYPIALVTREDVALYIDYRKADGASLGTIQKRHLAAIAGLFKEAIGRGYYAVGNNPAHKHEIYGHREKKKAKIKSGWRPFSDQDLQKIFLPANLMAAEKPCDFWLPLLGLFTGGRIQELCQLKCDDIRCEDGIWAIDINADGDDKSVKTFAGVRKIPLHPELIRIGFLEYLEDVKPYGANIFPYLSADRFGNYTKTPSRRFGDYLTELEITDERKVFHSFRSTSNNRLKQNGVPEESRCQFIGHEHDTVNSTVYSEAHQLKFLLDNVASKLDFPFLDLSQLKYPIVPMRERLTGLMGKAERVRSHKKAKERREAFF